MKLLFLDVDGVLNHQHSPCWEENGHRNLDSACVAELNRVLAATGAKIVVSSVWRLGDGIRDVAAVLPRGSIIGATPYRRMTDRKAEILDWLQKVWPLAHGSVEQVEAMAVVDDEADADLGDGSFFKTEFAGGGLTRRVADRLIAHLQAEAPVMLLKEARK